MTPRQKVFATLVALAFIVIIVELVRRRKLRIEYSWIWLITASMIMTVVWRYDWLEALTAAIGAVLPTTTLFIGSTLVLMFLTLHLSLRVSQLTSQVKNLTQEAALLRYELSQKKGESRDSPAPPAREPPPPG
ncbi:MAG: hypothetical protein GMKNLPBB_02484 [Myxococcota bacterium]|nr:hypothetical protein [Myxococcota bacterium]